MSEMIRRRRGIWMMGLVLLWILLPGCGTTEPAAGSQSGEFKGTVTVSGAFALYPMMVRWSEEFQVLHPEVQFDISAGGAGKGMSDALAGAVDIGMVSRPIFDEEVEKGAFWVAVAKDAVVATVNAQNPGLPQLLAQGATPATFAGIWITGDLRTWGEVLGSGTGDEIHVYTRADACGASQTWADYIGGYQQEDLLGVAVQADPGLAEAVRQDPLGIGYNNLNFAYDATTGKSIEGIAILPLDLNENGQIDPDEAFYDSKERVMAAIADGRYPSPPARALNLVTKGTPEGLTRAFMAWILTDGQSYLEEVGYIPLAQEQLEADLSKLQ